MTAQTRQWVQKAEADYDAVLLLRRSRKRSRFDTIRFHCQQCAEKYLKARLQEAGQRFPRTHDLAALLSMTLPIEPLWSAMHPGLAALTDAAVEFRYPSSWSTSDDAREAFVACRRLRTLARASLGLKAK
jgi:HEPN domain-containing protein